MKILYLYIHTRLLDIESHFFLGFIRISNYLNSKKGELNEPIEEEYLDLRYENLPKFVPRNLDIYRFELKKFLKKYYKKFAFDLVAISCYTSLNYINSVEIANYIKHYINPSCIIVVGGIHPSISLEDFQIGNFPDFIYDKYPRNTTPFDYLIKDEGEIPFFKLVRGIIDGIVKKRKNLEEPCIILKSEFIKDLDELPIINLKLFKKYKHIINKDIETFSIDFSRGCPFRCKFCYNSGDSLQHYKKVRIKPVEKCIKEIKVIKNTKWLNINKLKITDMIFFPKRSKREEFFKELERIFLKEGGLPFKIQVYDRIHTCSINDLKKYKRFNIITTIGLESCSKILLYRMGKFLGNNKEKIMKAIDDYLLKFEELVKTSNEIDFPIEFFYIIGLPGSDEKIFNENKNFLFRRRSNGKSLIEQYKINIYYNKYSIYKDTSFYDHCEEEFGTKFLKEWWKMFDKDIAYYPAIVEPSINFSLIDSLSKNIRLFRKIFRIQSKLGNSYYSNGKLDNDSNEAMDFLDVIKKNKLNEI